MNNKDKLIELLKKDSEVKNAIEQLEFGCRILNNHNWDIVLLVKKEIDFIMVFNWEWNWCLLNKNFKIIWLPLQERFIRMYWNSNCTFWSVLSFESNWLIRIFNDEWEANWDSINLDDTKDFDNQTEETYKQIFEALNNL